MSGFVDEAVVHASGGRGGKGSASFRRQPYEPRGGPDGGDGGRGGSVILEVSTDVFDLATLARNPHQRGEPGGQGESNNRTGAEGDDLVLAVPDGVYVEDERGPVADLVGAGARVVVAAGGRGGRGNATLATRRNRAPRVAEQGEPGEERRVRLELRLVADVGLVGLPNAGKSTLLSRLTAATPKIADYPFTTLTPNLGVAEDGDRRFVLADVPGLIEGAHTGKGLGDTFLRHISRCRALVYVVDLAGDDPATDLATVRAEVRVYDEQLAGRPSIVAATKVDLLELADVRERLGRLGEPGAPVSATTGEGMEALGERIAELAASAPSGARRPFVVLRPGREAFTVHRSGTGYRVEGRVVERWVAETDFDDETAVASLQNRLRREGIERRLAELGALRGDEVTIGGRAFEFIPEEA